jgi:hypothetical protein
MEVKKREEITMHESLKFFAPVVRYGAGSRRSLGRKS